MNSFALEIWDDESNYVTFYTVRWEAHEHSETDKFVRKFHQHELYHESLQKLLTLIFEEIGDRYGAEDAFFSRRENRAEALPPSSARIGAVQLRYPEFPLRLFCYKVNNAIVILFNGGLKTSAAVQESEDLKMPFYHANEFAKRLDEAFRDGSIKVDEDERIITDYLGSQDIIL